MIDVVFCVEVNALGFFLDSHDGEAHVNAAVELPFLNLDDDTHKRNTLEAKRDNVLCSNNNPVYFIVALAPLESLRKGYCRQLLILTSALHLPYFRMPLSKEKYLCREKSVQSVSVSINSSVCNIPDSKSEVMAVSMRS